jgi:serine protease inhibitor ecotin
VLSVLTGWGFADFVFDEVASGLQEAEEMVAGIG